MTTVARWVSSLVKKYKSRARKSSQNNQDNQRHGMASVQGSTGELYRLKVKQLRADGTDTQKIRQDMETVYRYGLLTASSTTIIKEKQIKIVHC